MECPVCNSPSELIVNPKPGGLIGCFCCKCKKGYITRDPEQGWDIGITEEYFLPDQASDLSIIGATLFVMRREFQSIINGRRHDES